MPGRLLGGSLLVLALGASGPVIALAGPPLPGLAVFLTGDGGGLLTVRDRGCRIGAHAWH
jgi:hypothetical protein